MAFVHERFDAFLGTYSETKDHFISGDIAQLIMNHITSQFYLTVNAIIHEKSYHQQTQNEFEIFTDELTCLFTKPSYYRMDWIYCLDYDNVMEFKQAENKREIVEKLMSEPSTKSKTIKSETFYDNKHCLSFVSGRIGAHSFTKRDGIYRVLLLDASDNIINQTEWILFDNSNNNIQYMEPRLFNCKDPKSFFNNTLDIDNNGYLDINQWMIYLEKEAIVEYDHGSMEILCIGIRYFYYIQFQKNNDSISENNNDNSEYLMSSEDFEKYVWCSSRVERAKYDSSTMFLYGDIRKDIIKRIPYKAIRKSLKKIPPPLPDVVIANPIIPDI